MKKIVSSFILHPSDFVARSRHTQSIFRRESTRFPSPGGDTTIARVGVGD
jgi:hypothetical protein